MSSAPADDASDVTVVVLAGGTSRRFGGADDDKLEARLGIHTVLDATLQSIPPAWPVIVVGPARAHAVTGAAHGTRAVTWKQESPPGGGPAAALVQALDVVTTPWCAVLAGDTPRGGNALPELLDAARATRAFDATSATGAAEASGSDGVVAVVDGRRQPLLAVYRAEALQAAAGGHGGIGGLSMRALLTPLGLAEIPVDPRLARDIDTVDDLAFHRAWGAS